MMFPIDWLSQPSARLLTIALVHFAWQGAAIALALFACVEICNVRRAATRYACSLIAFLGMSICPLVTLGWLELHDAQVPTPAAVAFPQANSVFMDPARLWVFEAAQPYALAVWLIGVVVFGSRLVTGALGLARLRRGRLPLPGNIATVVERLGHRMSMNALPLVFLSRQVAEGMAFGLLRPLVLIPAAWAAEMPMDMLEAVIAHELAHLRRRDLWVNLLQRVIETLLFYHPAVWWLSRRLRIERELCADELAVAATGERLKYVQALQQIAEERRTDIRPALAAFLRGETNMRLLERVRNVLHPSPSHGARLWPAGIVALAVPLGLWAAAMGGAATADDDREEARKSSVKRERQDEEGEGERRIVVRRLREGGEDHPPRYGLEDRELGDKDGRRSSLGERVELFFLRNPGEEPRVVERRIMIRDGKVESEIETERGEKRGERGPQDDRRIDELTALVKRLSSQVERLQDEVARLRGEKQGNKEAAEQREKAMAAKRQAEDRWQLENRDRVRSLKERIDQEVTEKTRAAGEKARTAEEKARAAREKGEAERESFERKLREIKDRHIDASEAKESLLRKLREQQSLLDGPRKPEPKKPATKKPSSEDDDDERRQ